MEEWIAGWHRVHLPPNSRLTPKPPPGPVPTLIPPTLHRLHNEPALLHWFQ